MDQIYLFRNGHWQFVQKYILENTKYAVATGGTPITTWLPNQIEACLRYEKAILDQIDGNQLPADDGDANGLSATWTFLVSKLADKMNLLTSQEHELRKADYDANLVYTVNEKYGLSDKGTSVSP